MQEEIKNTGGKCLNQSLNGENNNLITLLYGYEKYRKASYDILKRGTNINLNTIDILNEIFTSSFLNSNSEMEDIIMYFKILKAVDSFKIFYKYLNFIDKRIDENLYPFVKQWYLFIRENRLKLNFFNSFNKRKNRPKEEQEYFVLKYCSDLLEKEGSKSTSGELNVIVKFLARIDAKGKSVNRDDLEKLFIEDSRVSIYVIHSIFYRYFISKLCKLGIVFAYFQEYIGLNFSLFRKDIDVPTQFFSTIDSKINYLKGNKDSQVGKLYCTISEFKTLLKILFYINDNETSISVSNKININYYDPLSIEGKNEDYRPEILLRNIVCEILDIIKSKKNVVTTFKNLLESKDFRSEIFKLLESHLLLLENTYEERNNLETLKDK
ncbi:MAG: hypothetical protein N4A49_06475 [Marinifilaceae bacterium]|jgi:hypothetical protein|nr:hypothetical protein [Marinifilaceae bacterium]